MAAKPRGVQREEPRMIAEEHLEQDQQGQKPLVGLSVLEESRDGDRRLGRTFACELGSSSGRSMSAANRAGIAKRGQPYGPPLQQSANVTARR